MHLWGPGSLKKGLPDYPRAAELSTPPCVGDPPPPLNGPLVGCHVLNGPWYESPSYLALWAWRGAAPTALPALSQALLLRRWSQPLLLHRQGVCLPSREGQEHRAGWAGCRGHWVSRPTAGYGEGQQKDSPGELLLSCPLLWLPPPRSVTASSLQGPLVLYSRCLGPANMLCERGSETRGMRWLLESPAAFAFKAPGSRGGETPASLERV